MQIDFYINFTKRQNSTKRPAEGGIVTKHTLTGYLKEPCSVMKPVINIQNIPVQNAPCVMTYAYIPTFYRYYFVKDWVWNDGLWTVQLEVDVLATYRPHIGDSYAYIERSASQSNGRIVDKLRSLITQLLKQDSLHVRGLDGILKMALTFSELYQEPLQIMWVVRFSIMH